MNFSGINSNKRFWLPAVICLQVVIFIADVITPCYQADWNWNFLPLILSVWFGGRMTTYGLATMGSVSILLAFYLSPPSGLMDLQLALDSRLVGVGLFWICALLVNTIKKTKFRLQRSERALLMISECDQIIVRATEEVELLRAVCEAIATVGGYQMAWVGYAENDERKSVRVVAAAGQQKAYLDDANISWDEKNERGRGAIGIALRSGQPEIIRDLLHDLRMAPWHKRAAECGLKSAIALPLKSFDGNFGTLMLYAGEVDAFSAREVKLLTELVGDLAFGVQNLRTRVAQKAAEAKLASTQEQLETMVAAMPDAVFFKDGEGRWLITNKAASQLFQLEKRDWRGRTDAELAKDLPDLKAAHESCIASDETAWQAGTLSTGEEQIQLPNGETLIAEVFKQPLFYPDGKRKGLIAIGRDITARKNQEVEIARARDFYLGLLDNAPALVWRADTEAKCDWFNGSWLKFTGRKMEQEIGYGWVEGVHTDDLKRCVDYFLDAFHHRRAFVMEYRLLRHDGEYRWITDHGVPFQNLDGSFGGYIGFCYDITERKNAESQLQASEERYRKLVENARDLIFILAPDGAFISVNPVVELVSGLGVDHWIGKPFIPLVHPDDLPLAWEMFYKALNGENIPPYELRGHPNLPQLVSMEITLFARKDAHGTNIGVMGIGRDITARKKSQQALIESQEKLTTLIDSLPDNVILKDGKGRWLVANPPALQFFRLGPKAWQGRTDAELAVLNPPLKDLHEACIRSDEIGWAAKNITHTLERGPGLDGKLQEHEVTKVPLFDADGKRKALLVIGRDLTQTKQLQQSLRLSELMSRQSRDVLLLIRQRDGRIFSANDSALQMYGCSREQILAKTIHDLRSQNATNHIAAQLSEAFAHGVLFETVHRDKSGAEIPVEVSSQGFNFDGEYFLVSAVRDITERKKIESQLEVQRKFLVDLVENSPVAVFAKDRDGRCIMTNQAFMEIIGRKREKIIGHTTNELFPGLIGEQFRQKDLEIMAHGSCQTFEEFLPDGNGRPRTFITTKFPMRNESGEITGICGMTLEISKLKSAEAEVKRLATVVEQTVEGIFITNLAGAIIYANPAFEKITGYSRTEVIGKNPRLLKSDKQSAKFYNEMWETLKRGETWKGHFTNRRKDGSLYEEDAVITPIRDGGGKIVNYVAVKHDVTRELQLEAQFRQAQKMEAIGTLAGGIAHDFNNILMAIFVYGGMLKKDLEGQNELLEMVEQIVNSANRAKELVQQILTFSRQQEHKRQIIRLESVIKEATKFLRASLPVDIQVELNLSTEAPAVLADPTQIYQVVMNLATNSVHAMESKSGRLTISLEAFTPDQALLESNPKFQPISYARLTATDTGQGMDTKTLERIFEPFFTTKGVGKGTGLGLAVVHGIALSHDAVITVESEIGKGTSISLFFPAQKLENDSATQNIRDLPLGNGQSILVVDDEAPLATMFERLLKLLHYRPTVCTSPLQALALFKNNPDQFDLVVTDLSMPVMNGLELAGEIRAIREKIPVVMISGFITPETREDYLNAGIRELLQKPAAITDVAQVLQRNLT